MSFIFAPGSKGMVYDLFMGADPSDTFGIVPLWGEDGMRKRVMWNWALKANERYTIITQDQHTKQYKEIETDARQIWRGLIDNPEFGDALFLGTVCWTFDNRTQEKYLPYLCWREQAEVYCGIGRCIDGTQPQGKESCFVTKDRDTGGSYGVAGLLGKRWRFHSNFVAVCGSRVEPYVDNNTPDALMWKIDLIIDRLPEWCAATRYDKKNKEHRKEMMIKNIENGSIITGEAPTKNFGVGSRKDAAVFDEFPLWPDPGVSWESAQPVTPCRIAIGTPAEDKNDAYNIREGIGQWEGTYIRKFRLTWKNDPRKQETAVDANGVRYNIWLRKTIGDPSKGIPGEMSMVAFRRHYGDEWGGGTGIKIYAAYIKQARLVATSYNPRYPLYTSTDPGRGDSTFVFCFQWNYDIRRYQGLWSYTRPGQVASYFIPIILGRATKHQPLEHADTYDEKAWRIINMVDGWQRFNSIHNRPMPNYAQHVGDPFGDSKNWSGDLSGYQVWSASGIDVDYDRTQMGHKHRQETTRLLLPYWDFDPINCKEILDALEGYKRNATTNEPVHDENSHGASCFEFANTNVNMMPEIKTAARAQSQVSQPGQTFQWGDQAAFDRAQQIMQQEFRKNQSSGYYG